MPSGSTGGKKAYLDKVIWRYVPDPWDAAEALDWWQEPPLDFMPKIEQNTDLQTFLFDPMGAGKAGSGRTASTHHLITRRRARRSST